MQCIRVMEHLVLKSLRENVGKIVDRDWKLWRSEKAKTIYRLRFTQAEYDRVYVYTGDDYEPIVENGTTPYSCPVRFGQHFKERTAVSIDGSLDDAYWEYLRCGLHENIILGSRGAFDDYPNRAPHQLEQLALNIENPKHNRDTALESVEYLSTLNQ